MHFSLVPAAFAVCLLVAANGSDDEVKKELQKLQGDWVLVSGERDSKKVADEDVKQSKITYKGSEVTVVTPHQSGDPIKATFKIDPTKKPAEMEFVRSNGPGAGQTMKCIYEFIDGDQYRICFAPPGKDRPTEFKTSAGSGHTVHVWKRSKN